MSAGAVAAEWWPRIEAAAGQLVRQVAVEPLLQLALGGIVAVLVGGMFARALPLAAGLVRGLGNLAILLALVLTVAHTVHVETGIGVLDRLAGRPEAEMTVSGGETRARLGEDGHFWLTARIGGETVRFLVDTGATITTLSERAAGRLGLEADRDAPAIMLTTANGMTRAERTTIPEMRIGTVVVRRLGAVIAPGIGETNVLGMNFLSKLASWRVEGEVMVLVPHHPAPATGRFDGERTGG